jgi:2,3-bisphosphoglycerate-dependent phosphoglycerate mutase
MAATDTDLILLRHGETDWNRERRIQGQLDIPLNSEGVRQAAAAAARLSSDAGRWALATGADRPAVHLVSSDLQRCRHTAAPIAAALGLDCGLDSRLRERAYGVFEGRTYPEIRSEDAARFDRWQARDPDFRVDGAESLRSFARRVETVLVDLAELHRGRTLVLVTHGGVLDVVHRMARGLSLEAPRDFEVPNASLNRLRFSAGRFELQHWADVTHWRAALDEIGPD